MSLPLIVIGDKTTHGGTVISADLTFDINGKYVARIGDLTVCPKCKGIFPIKAGASDLVDGDGNGYARHMDQTACGAKLLSSQITTTWDNKTTLGDPAADEAAQSIASAAPIATPTKSGICLDCLLKAAAAGSATVVRE
ncbi:MAG: PAAR domain-containing protein [Pseudomonadota bacterium]